MRKINAFFIVVIVAAGLSGCSSSDDAADHPVTGLKEDGTPKWVEKGSGAYEGKEGKAFYGVGLVQGIQNPALSRRTADDRARGELAAIFDLYVARLLKDYQRSTTAEGFDASTEEQDITATQKTLTDTTLRGIAISQHWTDPRTETLYALAELDLDAMIASIEQAKNLSSRLRGFVRTNANVAFEDLDKELAKKDTE